MYINITSFVLVSQLEKSHSMIETYRLKDVVIFFQTILSFVLSRKILSINMSKLTLGVKHYISRRRTFSPNLHIVEGETLKCLPILQH